MKTRAEIVKELMTPLTKKLGYTDFATLAVRIKHALTEAVEAVMIEEKAVRNEMPLPKDANLTEIYTMEAGLNMADGYNLCIGNQQVRKDQFLNS